MKIYIVFLFFSLQQICSAQLFTKITTGEIVSHAGDSRSVNFADINQDGWEDIFITNGKNPGTVNFLYKNNGDGSFTFISDDDIVSHAQPFDGATFADMDNDGDLDCFVVTWYNKKNYFYRNQGDGSFSYESEQLISSEFSYAETASWGDFDEDGFVDLYVTNSEGDKLNYLYKNNEGISFTKIEEGEQSTDAFFSRSVNWTDIDQDHDLDLFVSNESNQKDNIYLNNGDGTFTELIGEVPVIMLKSTMSSSWGDIDHDCDQDLFVSNSGFFVEQDNQLFLNEGGGNFSSVLDGPIISDGGCSFASSFGDYDNDGDLDLIVMNGYCDGLIENFLYQNDGTGIFTRDFLNIEDLSTECSYGGAWGDVNNDGFLDLVIATCNNDGLGVDPNDIFYLNNTNENNWAKIKLIGTVSNASAIGATIKIKANINGTSVWQFREVSAQTGYCSQNSLIQHFGLGNAIIIDSAMIYFPSGIEIILTNVASNQVHEISETFVEMVFENEIQITSFINPNPTSDKIIITINDAFYQNGIIQILDTNGNIFFADKIQSLHFDLQLKQLLNENGNYILTISNGGKRISQKFQFVNSDK